MFDNNVFKANTCVNVTEQGAVVGYELQTNITYYRGIPMSMIEYIKVAVDGVGHPHFGRSERLVYAQRGRDRYDLQVGVRRAALHPCFAGRRTAQGHA